MACSRRLDWMDTHAVHSMSVFTVFWNIVMKCVSICFAEVSLSSILPPSSSVRRPWPLISLWTGKFSPKVSINDHITLHLTCLTSIYLDFICLYGSLPFANYPLFYCSRQLVLSPLGSIIGDQHISAMKQKSKLIEWPYVDCMDCPFHKKHETCSIQ